MIFHHSLRPFPGKKFAILNEYPDGAYFLQWDSGSEYNVLRLVDDKATAFKFLPETIAELITTSLTNNRLQFEGRQIPRLPVGGAVKTAADSCIQQVH